MACAILSTQRSPWCPNSRPDSRRVFISGSPLHCSISSISTCCATALRLATAEDLPTLVELEELTGGNWTPQQVEAELSRERATVLVADEGSGPVGWAVGWAVPQELHLMNIAVHPDHRRCGHARALLTSLFNQHRHDAECVLLEVRASNDAALRLYSSLGFERMGLRRRYYGDEEDAVLMTLLLEERQMN